MESKNSPLIAVFGLLKYTWRYLVKGLRLKTVLNQLSHRDHQRSRDLEIEAIKRFRALASFIPPKCRVYRELNRLETVICLDFADCPQELKMNEEEWLELTILLAISCDELGLAHSVAWKNGKQIVGWMTLEEIA